MGYLAGCRSRGGCPNNTSKTLLTCAEAAVAIRSDYRLARAHDHEPIERIAAAIDVRRSALVAVTDRKRHPSSSEVGGDGRRRTQAPVVHGTQAGYLRGCRTADLCPGGESGLTCRDARNEERRKCARRRGVVARSASVDAADAAARINELRQRGLTVREIAKRTSLGVTTITEIARGATTNIRPETFARILAVAAPDGTESSSQLSTGIPGLPTSTAR